MVNTELILFSVIIFLSVLFLYKFRKQLKVETVLGIPLPKPLHLFGLTITKLPIIYIAMIRTSIGLKFTDMVVNKFKRTSRYLGYFCVLLGFVSIGFLSYSLISHIITQLTAVVPDAGPSVAFVLPFKVEGAIYVPLMYWLISIFIIAFIHEFGHALIARAHNLKIKSTGPAFFGIILPLIPAAYVEPDEKELEKRSRMQQLSVFSAGSVFNIMLGILSFILLVFLSPFVSQFMINDGVEIIDIYSQNLKDLGMSDGEVIKEIVTDFENKGIFPIDTTSTLSVIMSTLSPGNEVTIITDKGTYVHTLEQHPADPKQSVIGVSLSQHQSFTPDAISKYGVFPLGALQWFTGLIVWIAILNVGIGLFNLSPIFPLDGGRMIKSSLKGMKFAGYVVGILSFVFLGVIIASFIV